MFFKSIWLKIHTGLHIDFDFVNFAQTWKGSWSGHTVVVKKLKTIGDVFRSGQMDNFHHEYNRLR